jgi:hypothetical protein
MEFYRMPVPADLVGTTVRDALPHRKDRLDALLVGLSDDHRAVRLNPRSDDVLGPTHELLVVASRPPEPSLA